MSFIARLNCIAECKFCSLHRLAEELRSKESDLDQVAEYVFQREMRLLNIRRDLRRNDDVIIAQRRHLATVMSAEADRRDAQLSA